MRIVVLLLGSFCLMGALAQPMPQYTTQWYLAQQVFGATASAVVDCPPDLPDVAPQQICAVTGLTGERFRHFAHYVLEEYLERGTLVALRPWRVSNVDNDVHRRAFGLEQGTWLISLHERDESGSNLVVIRFIPQQGWTSPLLTPP